jgi:lysophospholipid acyltransferase (LPLAT)-like uncharacterized protein
MNLLSPESLGKLAWHSVEAIGKTLSITEYGSDEEFYRDGGRPMIYALWHGRLFIPLFRRRNRGVHILVSEHRDGDIIASSLDSAGCRTVRGSTTRGGSRALVRLIKLMRQGEKVAFTPDGPRGPRWKFQTGAVYLAAKTGFPVIPITGSAHRAMYFKSWDSFQLPLPFTKGVLIIGEPYRVTGGTDDANIEFHRGELERRLVALTREADRLAGAPEGR